MAYIDASGIIAEGVKTSYAYKHTFPARPEIIRMLNAV